LKNKWKDLSILAVGFLTTTMGFLATLNIKFEWLTAQSIDAFGAFLVAAAMLISGFIATWKNTHLFTKDEGIRKKALQAQKKKDVK
jgi:divalent metal cation (Fe/Co/Zn/Cd) transporter